MYDALKIIHVISASILFGAGLGTTFYMWYGIKQKDMHLTAKILQQSILGNLVFTTSAGALLAVTGFVMVGLKNYQMNSIWVSGSILGYFIAGACWMPALFLQINCRALIVKAINNAQNPSTAYYKSLFKWKIFTLLAFAITLVVFYLMTGLRHHLG